MRSDKQRLAALAQATQTIVATGGYHTADGHFDVSAAIAACREQSQFVPATRPITPFARSGAQPQATIEIADEGTLAAAKRLHDRGLDVAALNFASYRNAGGGWLRGADAQEESLARCSALHAALTAPGPCAAHYQKRNDHNPLYSHDMILSPAVPVLRSEAGELVRPWPLAFVSAAAPNAGIARKNGVAEGEIEAALAERAERVLALAARGGHDALVLGAWGCGVFKNDPDVVARVWGALLAGRYRGAFKCVAFPLKCFSPAAIAAFGAALQAGHTALPASLPASPAMPAASPATHGDGDELYSRSPASFGGPPPFGVRRGSNPP